MSKSSDDAMSLSQRELMEVLYELYGARGDDGRSRIRNRFKSLLKVNLPTGDRPQHGRREKYKFSQLCEVVVIFELAQYGIDAWESKEIIDDISLWASRLAAITKSKILREDHDNEFYVLFRLRLVSAAVSPGSAGIIIYEGANGSVVHESQLVEEFLLGAGCCLLNLEMLATVLLSCLPIDLTRSHE